VRGTYTGVDLKLATLNEGKVAPSTNAPVASCFDLIGDDPNDREPLGDAPLMPCLGVTAIPYPPDADGHAEGIIATGVGGLPSVCIAGWDTRTHAIAGNAKPGDTILHSTGPSKAAQVQLKETKRQAVVVTRGTDNKQMMVLLDGKNDKIQIAGFGYIIELSQTGIELAAGANGISINEDAVHIRGNVIVGGMVPPPGMCLAMATPAAWAVLSALAAAATPGTPPLTPAPGVKAAL
jgi:hypothetical protein